MPVNAYWAFRNKQTSYFPICFFILSEHPHSIHSAKYKTGKYLGWGFLNIKKNSWQVFTRAREWKQNYFYQGSAKPLKRTLYKFYWANAYFRHVLWKVPIWHTHRHRPVWIYQRHHFQWTGIGSLVLGFTNLIWTSFFFQRQIRFFN